MRSWTVREGARPSANVPRQRRSVRCGDEPLDVLGGEPDGPRARRAERVKSLLVDPTAGRRRAHREQAGDGGDFQPAAPAELGAERDHEVSCNTSGPLAPNASPRDCWDQGFPPVDFADIQAAFSRNDGLATPGARDAASVTAALRCRCGRVARPRRSWRSRARVARARGGCIPASSRGSSAGRDAARLRRPRRSRGTSRESCRPVRQRDR
jgi:hypothetical protein